MSVPRILMIACNRRNLEVLGEMLAKEGYSACGVDTLAGLDAALEGAGGFALALVDLSGFDASIWERCERLREAGVPFLLLSPRQSAELQREGLRQGARGILIKPLAVRELLQLVRVLTDTG